MEYVGWPNGSTSLPLEPQNMLPGRIEGYPQGTQRGNNNAEDLLATAVAYWDASQYRDGDRFLRNRGIAGDLLDLRLGSSITPNTNDPLFLAPENKGYVYLPGFNGNHMQVQDEAALRLTGGMDIRAHITPENGWETTSTQTIISKQTAFPSPTGYRFGTGYFGGWGRIVLTVTNGSGETHYGSTASLGTALSGTPTGWIRCTYNPNTGAGQYEAKFWTSTDGISWTQLGTTLTGATPTPPDTSATTLYVGSYAGSYSFAGSIHRAIVKDGIDGTTVLDVDCSQITSGSNTSFTALTGQTVKINRSTSGRKSVAVPSRGNRGGAVFLFGTDDFMEVVDNWQHQLLNFGQGDSFTVLAVVRQWATINNYDSMVSKVGSLATSSLIAGWGFGHGYKANAPMLKLSDNSVGLARDSGSLTNGELATVAGVRDTGAGTVTVSIDGVSGSPVADTTTSLANSEVMRVGRMSGADTNYIDMEFTAAAIFRRALTPAEIKTISDYFTARIA